MQKIPTLFVRDSANPKLVTREVTPGAEWVLKGEGEATVKKDGTNVRVDIKDGKLVAVWKRHRSETDPRYIPATRTEPSDKYIFEAVDGTDFSAWPDGEHSCEALGPRIQGGVESAKPCLYRFMHGAELVLDENPRDFDSLKAYFETHVIEGIVWHHPDGRMVKIKRRDFGLSWKQDPRWRETALAELKGAK